MQPGWLAAQLPRPLAEDEFTSRFIRIFEDIAGGIRVRATDFDKNLDIGLAAPEFLRMLGEWLGLHLDTTLSDERQRALVRTVGTFMLWRGTRRGLEGFLEALTGKTVTVEDEGGVFPQGKAKPNTHRVTVTLSGDPGVNEPLLLAMIQGEIPADATVTLKVKGRKSEAGAPQESKEST